MDELHVYASSICPGLIAITETWLNSAIQSTDLDIANYTLFRYDRQDGRAGGGVCCYIRNELPCKLSKLLTNPPSTIECLRLHLPQSKLSIILAYVPPGLKAEVLNEIEQFLTNEIEDITDHLPDNHVILLGDFNQLPTKTIEILYGLTQVVQFNTRENSTLDKILIDDDTREQYFDPVPGPNFGKADHLSIFMKPKTTVQKSPSRICKVFDYRRSNMSAVVEMIRTAFIPRWYKWKGSVDEKAEYYQEVISRAMSMIPFVYIEMDSQDKPWMTPLLKLLMNRKHQAFHEKNVALFQHYQEKLK